MEDDSDNPPGRRPQLDGDVPALSQLIDNMGRRCQPNHPARANARRIKTRVIGFAGAHSAMTRHNKDWLYNQEVAAGPGQ